MKYSPEKNKKSDFIEEFMVDQIKLKNYKLKKKGIFINCISLNNPLQHQGWKIHVSASNHNYLDVLLISVPYIVSLDVSFKVVSQIGENTMLSKSFPREQTGKFITIYPHNIVQCRTIVNFLNKKLEKYNGIPVLTDKRISKNNEISIRYGAFRKILKYDDEGDPVYSVINKEGAKEPDNRAVGHYKPDWVIKEPIMVDSPNTIDNKTKLMLKKYRFIVALQFNNFGGVYEAINRENNKHVVIKEARKYIGGISFAAMIPADVRVIRRREYNALLDLSNLKVAPAPIDYFKTKDGDYLVEEYVNWQLLKQIRLQNPVYYPNSCEKDYQIYLQKIAKIFKNLYKTITVINNNGLIINDLTPNNVLYNPKTLEVKIIDLESCTKKNNAESRKSIFVTPGYTEMLYNNEISTNDKFSWLMCLIDSLICRAQILNIDSAAILLSLDFVKNLYDGWSELCNCLKICFINRKENNYSKVINEIERIVGEVNERRSI